MAINTESIVLPIVHLNGTSRETLQDTRSETYRALDDALSALKRMAPNGRDYYVSPGLMEAAQKQHERRMQAITDLMDEIEYECNEIAFD